MASPTEHIHHLATRSTHMDMPSSNRSDRTEDCETKLKDAQEEIERIQEQREKLGRKILELEKLTSRKQAFVSQQLELTEKLTSTLTLIDRALFETRNEAEDIEQCRACFADHLDKIQKFNPENWTHDNLPEKLERATMAIDLATAEFDQVAAHFEGSRVGAVFGRSSKRSRLNKHQGVSSEFMTNLRNGFAFNLPVLVLAGVILLVYLSR